MPHFLKIAENFNTTPLLHALAANPHLFGRNRARSEAYDSPHTEMTDIWVRYNDIRNLDREAPQEFNENHESVWYPESYGLPEVRQIAFDLMHFVHGERLGGILITKIPDGGEIKPHTDAGWHAGYYEKFYLPIQNHKGAAFGFPDGVIDAKPGEVYWFDNSVTHWVANRSGLDRIALIICIKTDKFKGLRG